MYKDPGLSGDEASLYPGQFKRGLGPELVLPWPWGSVPIACTVLWAHFAMAVLIPRCRWAFRGVSLNHIELASPSLESQLGF